MLTQFTDYGLSFNTSAKFTTDWPKSSTQVKAVTGTQDVSVAFSSTLVGQKKLPANASVIIDLDTSEHEKVDQEETVSDFGYSSFMNGYDDFYQESVWTFSVSVPPKLHQYLPVGAPVMATVSWSLFPADRTPQEASTKSFTLDVSGLLESVVVLFSYQRNIQGSRAVLYVTKLLGKIGPTLGSIKVQLGWTSRYTDVTQNPPTKVIAFASGTVDVELPRVYERYTPPVAEWDALEVSFAPEIPGWTRSESPLGSSSSAEESWDMAVDRP